MLVPLNTHLQESSKIDSRNGFFSEFCVIYFGETCGTPGRGIFRPAALCKCRRDIRSPSPATCAPVSPGPAFGQPVYEGRRKPAAIADPRPWDRPAQGHSRFV